MARYSPFETRRRQASRIALYSSLALSGLLVVLLLGILREPLTRGLDMAWADTDFAALPEVDLLRRYVRIDTSYPEGSELAGARFLAEELAAAGVPVTVEELGGGRVNLWAVVEGEDPEALVLHHHIDVDPSGGPERWQHDPFGAEIEGPWLYGRGAFDMKSIGVAHLLAFLDVARRAREGERPERSVILLATSSEETGSELGMRWILEQHPDLVERFWGVLTEGGAVEVTEAEGVKYWGIEFAQKRYVDFYLCGPDRQRLEQAGRDLAALAQPLHPLRLTPEVARFLDAYAPSRHSPELRALLADPERLTWDHAAFLDAPLPVQSMLRDEIYLFSLEEAPGGGFRLAGKIHLLPGSDLNEVVDRLLPEHVTHGLGVRVVDDEPPASGSPLDHPLYRALEDRLLEDHARDAVGPLFLAWKSTDARFLRAAGVPVYGFSPFAVPTPEVVRLVGAAPTEERIALPGYVEGVALYRQIVEDLAFGE